MTRREFGGAVMSLAFGAACFAREPQGRGDGRLRVHPRRADGALPAGTHPLALGADRDGLLHVPGDARPGGFPLLVLLHGAGGRGAGILRRLESFARDAGLAVLAPDSRGMTWDVIRDGFGPDVEFLDRALGKTFASVPIDPARVAVGGFSDGASYALSVGLINGELFRRVIAFSPGFYVGGIVQGRPRIFVSHGRADEILPIDRCSRLIVPRLKQQGYDVTFRQFDGGHEIPPQVAREGMRLVGQV